MTQERPAKAEKVSITCACRQLLQRAGCRLEQGSRGFEAHAIDELLGRLARSLLQSAVQCPRGRAERAREVLDGDRIFARRSNRVLGFEQEAVGRLEMTGRNIGRLRRRNRVDHREVGDALGRIGAAEQAHDMQAEVDPGQRPAGGDHAPIIDQRSAPYGLGSGVAVLQLIVTPPGRRAASPVEKARFAQQKHTAARAADYCAPCMLTPQPGAGGGDAWRGQEPSAVAAQITGNDDGVAAHDRGEARVDVQSPSAAVLKGPPAEARRGDFEWGGLFILGDRLLADQLRAELQHVDGADECGTQAAIEADHDNFHDQIHRKAELRLIHPQI